MELSHGVKGNGVECATFFLDAIKWQQDLRPYATNQNKPFLSTNFRQRNRFFWTNCDKAAETVVVIIIDHKPDEEVSFLKKPFRAMQALGAWQNEGDVFIKRLTRWWFGMGPEQELTAAGLPLIVSSRRLPFLYEIFMEGRVCDQL